MLLIEIRPNVQFVKVRNPDEIAFVDTVNSIAGHIADLNNPHIVTADLVARLVAAGDPDTSVNLQQHTDSATVHIQTKMKFEEFLGNAVIGTAGVMALDNFNLTSNIQVFINGVLKQEDEELAAPVDQRDFFVTHGAANLTPPWANPTTVTIRDYLSVVDANSIIQVWYEDKLPVV